MKILSWDCAYKTLAYVYLDVDVNILDKIFESLENLNLMVEKFGASVDLKVFQQNLDGLLKIIDNFIVVIDQDVVNVLRDNTRETSEIERTKQFYKFMKEFKHNADRLEKDTIIVIEHQPATLNRRATNNISTVVANQLLFHYAEFEINYINPKNKNKFCLAPGLDIDTYYNKYSSKYNARKMHSTANYDYFINTLKIKQPKKIDSGLKNHIADAFMQLLYLVFVTKKYMR